MSASHPVTNASVVAAVVQSPCTLRQDPYGETEVTIQPNIRRQRQHCKTWKRLEKKIEKKTTTGVPLFPTNTLFRAVQLSSLH